MEENAELESMVSENRQVEKGQQIEEYDEGIRKQKELGGIRTMPFILVSEACDRFAYSGYHSNLITYLTQIMNMPLVQASNTITNFNGTASFSPLIGAFIADSYVGRFWTIIVSSAIYVLGMITFTTMAILPQLRPPSCPTQVNCQEASNRTLSILYIALTLNSLGFGGIRSCVMPFAADQFDMSKAKTEARSWNFFNWYAFFMEVAILLALVVLVYIEDKVSWAWGLGIPTIALFLSLVGFIAGTPLYKKLKPAGSPYTRVVQVVVSAVRKRRAIVPTDPSDLYENRSLDADISVNGKLLHSNQFKCLDRAAVVTNSDIDESNELNLWRLATVHRVEELKTIIRILPVWASTVFLIATHSNIESFSIEQARTMDRHISSSFQIPPASMLIFSTLTMMSLIPVYDRVFVPFARSFTKIPAGITCLQRMGIGLAINIFSTVAAAQVEINRKHKASKLGLLDKPAAIVPMSVFWLIPQFALHGLAEVFMTVGRMEFLYDQVPESMRSTGAALYWIAIGMGNYLGTFIVSMVHKYTRNKVEWLPDRNLNRGRLENFYWLMTAIQVVNLAYYVTCAWFYTYKSVQEKGEADDFECGGDEKVGLVHCKKDQQVEMGKI